MSGPAREPSEPQERARARRDGFALLGTWVALGVLLELAHAVKLSAYLDHPLRRELLTWAHAHGVGLALVVLAYAAVGVHPTTARYGRLVRGAALLIPLGFGLSVFGHGEADPGPAIWLVPLGALLLLRALVGITRGLPRI